MNRGLKRQVNPKVAALAILAVITIVQVIWWRGLVMKPKPAPSRPPEQSRGPQMHITVIGREDVLVATLAGAPEPGNADGIGRNARFDAPTGLALDAQGNLYVADCRNHRIRMISPRGFASTVAGSEAGYADGPVAQARFNLPCGVAVGPDGAIYVADTGNHRIRRIHNGQVVTLAGGAPGMADGTGAAARFNRPCALAYVNEPAPALLVADALNKRVRKVSLSGIVQGGWTTSGVPTCVVGAQEPVFAVPQSGAFFIGSQTLKNVPVSQTGDVTQPSQYALRHPMAFCPAPGGGWFAVDTDHAAVFRIRDNRAEMLAGIIWDLGTYAGWIDDTGNRARFGAITSVVADNRGHVYVSDTTNNSIRRLTLPMSVAEGRMTLP